MELWKEEPSYYGGDELHFAKKEKIQKALVDNELEAILLLKAETVRYATDFYVKGYRPFYEPEYLAVIPRGQDTVVGYTSGSDNYRIQIRSDIKDHRKLPGFSKWGDEVVKIFKDYGITTGKVGVELLPYQMYLQLKAEFPAIEFVDISKIWVDLTAVKHPAEIAHLRRAVDIAVAGCNAALEFVKPGVKEYEVAAYAEYKMRAMGSEMTPFVTNVASGVNAAIFERISTEKVIEKNEMVIIDLGSVYRGYTGDVGRSVCAGKPTDIQKQIYKVNYLALQEALKTVKPGNTCADVEPAGLRPPRCAVDQQGCGLRAASRHGDGCRAARHDLRSSGDRRNAHGAEHPCHRGRLRAAEQRPSLRQGPPRRMISSPVYSWMRKGTAGGAPSLSL